MGAQGSPERILFVAQETGENPVRGDDGESRLQ